MITRELAVEIASSFKGTPYVLGAAVKGAGVDCATLLRLYLQECGFAKSEDFADIGLYAGDWFCHANSERYLLQLMRHAPKVLDTICRGTVDAKPGSLVLFRVAGSKLFNHGGIITKWPFMLHATQEGVKESNATTYFMTSQREMAIFDPWSNEC